MPPPPARSLHQQYLGPPIVGRRDSFAAEAGPALEASPLPVQQLCVLCAQALHLCPQGRILTSCSLIDHCLQQACRASLHSHQAEVAVCLKLADPCTDDAAQPSAQTCRLSHLLAQCLCVLSMQ